MNDPRREVALRIFGTGTGRRYEEIVDTTTGGRDRLWKQQLLDRLDRPRRVLDLACGTGLLTFAIRDRFPDAEVVGVELNPEYLEVAEKQRIDRADGLVCFVLGAAEEAAIEGRFDAVTSCYLPKYADLKQLVPKLVDKLARGGSLVLYDFVYPADPVVARAWRWGFEQNRKWAQKNLPEAVTMFDVLPNVIRESSWPEELTALLEHHGMTGIGRQDLHHGQVALMWASKPQRGSPAL